MSRPDSDLWNRSDLTYCANVHPAGTVAAVLQVLERFVRGVRERRGIERMGTGLWLSAEVAAALAGDIELRRIFRQSLHRHGLYLYTLNGFPYGGFHSVSVKQRVYEPNWTTPERRRYTLELARILAECLPEECREGTISTLPLGYRHPWSADQTRLAAENLCGLAEDLHQLRLNSGQSIRVCLEMEPDGVLESTHELIQFFRQDLREAADRLGLAPESIMDHLGACFDICHQSVMFEDMADSLTLLAESEIAIGKIQISSALEVAEPARAKIRKALSGFSEPRYLHQVRTRRENGLLAGAPDLPEALGNSDWPTVSAWRVHFHVPLHIPKLGERLLETTQREIGKVLEVLAANPGLHPHLEVETYTWQVLPNGLRPETDHDLVVSLVRELDWVEEQMSGLGILQSANPAIPSG